MKCLVPPLIVSSFKRGKPVFVYLLICIHALNNVILVQYMLDKTRLELIISLDKSVGRDAYLDTGYL